MPMSKSEEKKVITTYQIRSVLRIYGNQLKQRNRILLDSGEQTSQTSEFVNISMEARKKQILNQVSNQLISQIHMNNEKGPDYPGSATDQASKVENLSEV